MINIIKQDPNMRSVNKLKKKNQSFSLNYLRNWITFLLISYFLISIGNELKNQKEIFPFFSWFLFSDVPNSINRFDLLVHESNGKKFNPPIPMQTFSQSTISSGSIVVEKLISNLGKNYYRGNQKEVQKLRLVLESKFFPGEVQYELIQESYTPIEKWKTGQSKKKSLAFFRTGDLK